MSKKFQILISVVFILIPQIVIAKNASFYLQRDFTHAAISYLDRDDCDGYWRYLWARRNSSNDFPVYALLTLAAMDGVHPELDKSPKNNKMVAFYLAMNGLMRGDFKILKQNSSDAKKLRNHFRHSIFEIIDIIRTDANYSNFYHNSYNSERCLSIHINMLCIYPYLGYRASRLEQQEHELIEALNSRRKIYCRN